MVEVNFGRRDPRARRRAPAGARAARLGARRRRASRCAPVSRSPRCEREPLAVAGSRARASGAHRRVAADPQRRNARWQPRHRLAGRRRVAGARGARRRRRARRSRRERAASPSPSSSPGPSRTRAGRRGDRRRRGRARARTAGVRQGRNAQRDGDLGRERRARGRHRGAARWRARSGRSVRRSCARPKPSGGSRHASTGSAAPCVEARRSRRASPRMVADAARPIDDHRSTAAYRRAAIEVCAAACARAGAADDHRRAYRLTVNGTDHDVADGWIGESLLYVLRERLGLPGAKNACEQGRVWVVLGARRRRVVLRVPRARGDARRRRGHDRRGHRRRRARSPTCSGRSSPPARCSAGSARPAS